MSCRAQSLSLSKNERGCAAAAGPGMARTTPPALIMFLKALNVTVASLNSSVTSAMTSGLRRSGLSVPNLSIASLRDERKFRRHRLAASKLFEHTPHDRLDRLEHVLLGDEAHLQVELIEFTGRTIGA